MASRDPYDISPLLDENDWTINISGDDWIIPAYQCVGVRVTEIDGRPFDALRLESPADVVRDFFLSGVIVDDRLVPGALRLGLPSSLRPPGAQPFNTWIKIRRWRADRPVILEIYNRCPSGRRFRATLSIRDRSNGAISHVPLGYPVSGSLKHGQALVPVATILREVRRDAYRAQLFGVAASIVVAGTLLLVSANGAVVAGATFVSGIIAGHISARLISRSRLKSKTAGHDIPRLP